MVDVSARTVLIVDDEELIRLMLVDEFRDAGFDVADADSADAAFKILTQPQDAFDLLVTDVRMPGATDGLALASWTREYCGADLKEAAPPTGKAAHWLPR